MSSVRALVYVDVDLILQTTLIDPCFGLTLGLELGLRSNSSIDSQFISCSDFPNNHVEPTD